MIIYKDEVIINKYTLGIQLYCHLIRWQSFVFVMQQQYNNAKSEKFDANTRLNINH